MGLDAQDDASAAGWHRPIRRCRRTRSTSSRASSRIAASMDRLISALAEGWTLARMPAVDRNVLRLGAFELLYRPDVPEGVAVSEAVELASKLSTDESASFVNGVLARVAERRAADEAERRAADEAQRRPQASDGLDGSPRVG